MYPADAKSCLTEETLMLGKVEGKWRKRWQRMKWLDSNPDPMDMNLSKLQETVKDKEAWGAAVYGTEKTYNLATDQQQKSVFQI